MRLRVAGSAVGAVAIVALSVVAAWLFVGPAGAATTTLFASMNTPGSYPVSVPAGICFVTISADGGHGGASSNGQVGGVAASVGARVAVTAGSALTVEVGGVGGDGTLPVFGGSGGIGGGGGGAGGNTAFSSPSDGGGAELRR